MRPNSRKAPSEFDPSPPKMDKDHSGGCEARAKAMHRYYDDEHGVFYVGVAGPQGGGWYLAGVIREGMRVDGLSYRASSATHGEEVAISSQIPVIVLNLLCLIRQRHVGISTCVGLRLPLRQYFGELVVTRVSVSDISFGIQATRADQRTIPPTRPSANPPTVHPA